METNLQTFEERVEERVIGPCRLVVLKTPVREVVSFAGSFYTYPDFAAGEGLVQNLTVSLLDKGTRRRDRFEIADVLETRGAQLNFYSDGLRVGFSGRTLRVDVAEVLDVVAEQLAEPRFDAEEVEKAKAYVGASLQRSLESTATQASALLARHLFRPSHPNHVPPAEGELSRLQTLTGADVRQYHDTHFGANEFVLVLVGDVEADEVASIVQERFGDWAEHQARPRFDAEAAPSDEVRSVLHMPDKNNVDVRLGHALPVRRQDEAYLPLYVGTYILGGNFSARLMAIVRDEMGLTYGIRSNLTGITTQYHGRWQVGVTLSHENLARGIEATQDVVRQFVTEGPTPAELEEKKMTITGSYQVGLATTSNLASSLLHNVERGFGVGYLDRFPQEVEAVTLDAVRAAVQQHLHPDRCHIAMAGMLPGETSSAG